MTQIKLGDLLRRHRLNATLKQTEIAKLTGYNHTYVSRVERSEQQPSHEYLIGFMEGLALSADERAEILRLYPSAFPSEAEPSVTPPLPPLHQRWKRHIILTSVGIVAIFVTAVVAQRFWTAGHVGSSLTNQWCEHFDNTTLDKRRWSLVEDKEGLIAVRDGAIHFIGEPLNKDTVGAKLILLPIGRPIKEISFTTTLVSSKGTIPAGAGLEAFLQSGRDFALMIGPGSEGPEAEFYLCPNSSCNGEYEKYNTNRAPLSVGSPIPIRVFLMEKRINFSIGDFFQEQEQVNEPLTKLQFSMFGKPGSDFHVTADNVCVTYDEN